MSLEKLAESEHRHRKLVEALPDAIIVHSESKIVFVNPFAVRLHHAKRAEQLLGHDISEFIKPGCLPAIEERIELCYSHGVASEPMETVLIGCDGSCVDAEAVAIPISWNGAPAIEVVLRDIRQRKRAQEAAVAWQKRLELAQNAGLQIGLWDWDVAANTVTWSDESYRQFGYSRGDFSGRVDEAVTKIHPEDRARVEDAIQAVLKGGAKEYAAQYRLVHPAGTIVWIDAHGVIIRNGSTHMIGIGIDVTDLKRIEQSLRESEEKYRKLFENAMYGVFLAKPDGTLLDVNPALITMLGYGSREELLTRNLRRGIYENPVVRDEILRKAKPKKRVEGAVANWIRKDGTIITVRMSGAAILSPDGNPSHFEVIVEDISQKRE